MANGYNRKNLMTAIQMYDFYMYELQLYLDTHPTCANALEAYSKYKQLREKAYQLYAENFGPLLPWQSDCKNHFSWVNEPWPWERSDN